MASEWWTSPSEAERRLAAVNRLWNDVANAALGRSTTPIVSPATADWVVAEVAAFKQFRDQVEGWQFGVSWADELGDWTARANAARARIAAELAEAGKPAALPAPVTQWDEVGPQMVAKAFAGTAGLMLGGAAIVLVLMMSRR